MKSQEKRETASLPSNNTQKNCLEESAALTNNLSYNMFTFITTRVLFQTSMKN